MYVPGSRWDEIQSGIKVALEIITTGPVTQSSHSVIVAKDPHYESMTREIFAPILTLYVYEDDPLDQALDLVDSTSEYALTGAVFASNRQAIIKMTDRLAHSAGNFYINDKPTGPLSAGSLSGVPGAVEPMTKPAAC